MDEIGGGPDERHVRTGVRDSASAYQAALDVLDQTPAPTALVCGNNLITAGVVHAMQKLGVRDRVAVIGFDDLELADLLQPGLTVVAQDIAAIGWHAADLLFRRLQHPTDSYERAAVPVTLIPRGSGEIPAPDDRQRW
jgi:LacI family transcriptional regulator